MKKTLLRVFALAGAFAAVAAVSAAADSPGAAPAEIAGYKNWTRMSAEPLVVENPSPGG